jgi:adenylosuccinate synthase
VEGRDPNDLPNDLHIVSGIALNMSIWAAHLAQLIDAMLQIETARDIERLRQVALLQETEIHRLLARRVSDVERLAGELRIHRRQVNLPPLPAQISAERAEPLIADVSVLLRQEMKRGSNVMFEGAQGALLDVDVGTYPFVTSSNTIAGGAAVGTGLGPRDIHAVLGIVKAYTTRVGAGPFPTELFDETGEHLSRVGHEFGAVTGRARRCGWFDAVAMRRAVMHNSLSSLGVTKLDVMDGLDTLRICRRRSSGGGRTDTRVHPLRTSTNTTGRPRVHDWLRTADRFPPPPTACWV